MRDLSLMLRHYRLMTAEIVYGLPDHPHLVQTYTWQEYDIAPQYPELRKFLAFWEREIEGPIRQVRITSLDLVQPTTYSNLGGGYFRLQ